MNVKGGTGVMILDVTNMCRGNSCLFFCRGCYFRCLAPVSAFYALLISVSILTILVSFYALDVFFHMLVEERFPFILGQIYGALAPLFYTCFLLFHRFLEPHLKIEDSGSETAFAQIQCAD